MNDRLRMILAMAAFGTIPLFVRGIPLTSAEIALLRAVIALVCLMGYRALRGRQGRTGKTGRELPLLILSGGAMGFNWICLFEAYRYTTVAVATLSYYFAAVIVMVASALLFRERPSAVQAACFVGATLGLILVISPGRVDAGGHMKGVALGLCAAALYACVILMNKGIRRVGGLDRTILQFAAAAAVLLPYVMARTGVHLGAMTPAGWACLLCLGALHSGLAYCLYFSALSRLSGQEAAILSYIDPLVAVLISLLALGEPASAAQLLGGAMILGFTLYNELCARGAAGGGTHRRRQ